MARCWRALGPLALLVIGGAGACLSAPRVRDDIAVIEGGDAMIHAIDRVPLRAGSYGPYELRPGGHTFDVTASTSKYQVVRTVFYRSGLRTICLKARGGHRYRIKAAVEPDNRLRVFIIDVATGEAPKTPCGPDEDDD